MQGPYKGEITEYQQNAIVMFDGRKLFLSALVPIRAGDQIFISYIDTTCSRDERM